MQFKNQSLLNSDKPINPKFNELIGNDKSKPKPNPTIQQSNKLKRGPVTLQAQTSGNIKDEELSEQATKDYQAQAP